MMFNIWAKFIYKSPPITTKYVSREYLYYDIVSAFPYYFTEDDYRHLIPYATGKDQFMELSPTSR